MCRHLSWHVSPCHEFMSRWDVSHGITVLLVHCRQHVPSWTCTSKIRKKNLANSSEKMGEHCTRVKFVPRAFSLCTVLLMSISRLTETEHLQKSWRHTFRNVCRWFLQISQKKKKKLKPERPCVPASELLWFFFSKRWGFGLANFFKIVCVWGVRSRYLLH
jgi:hypothetical protein